MAASDYHHGDMDVSEQSSTYHLFLGLTKWGSFIVALLVTFLSIWFCTRLGFMGAAALSVVAGGAIGYFLKTRH
jgi:hypothetical protein